MILNYYIQITTKCWNTTIQNKKTILQNHFIYL